MRLSSYLTTSIAALSFTFTGVAHDAFDLDSIEVQGRSAPLVGEATSASQGFIGRIDLENRPMLRGGEILEAIPGLIVTQHSGSGKANQYFLRGFNLDHGTDFATWVDGMPVNIVSHGHGQGYADLNFIIPELTESVSYLKGAYYSAVGDFSSAGSASIQTFHKLDKDFAKVTLGENEYMRFVGGASSKVGENDLLFGIERATNNGPWDVDEDLDKINGLLRFSKATNNGNYSLSLMGYDSSWNSADQIPERVVDSGLISDLGSIDTTLGGRSSRYSLSADWLKDNGNRRTAASAYAIRYDLNLWSNFTYYLDDPVNGDQFEQSDRRMTYGGALTHTLFNQIFLDRSARHTFGIQTRYDDVGKLGLYHTVARERIGTYREDSLGEFSISVFEETQIQWTREFRTVFGLRADYFDFDVESNLPANSGNRHDSLISPKFNASYAPTQETEYYLSAGYGFHSNDARGSTITVDPSDGQTPVERVDPLVQSLGAEIGVRHNWNGRSNSSIALWGLQLDSELLYVGDAGGTEASRASERYGIEIANYFAASDNFSIDVDVAITEASYRDQDPSGDQIPGAIDAVASIGLNYNPSSNPWFANLRMRHFGKRPLVEDRSVESDPFLSFNLRVGYQTEAWRASIDVLNIFDSNANDITYNYASRLQGEPAEGVEDRHFHVIEPRSIRLNITRRF